MTDDGIKAKGLVEWELRGADGTLKASGRSSNIITQVGDQYLGERAAGISSPPGQVTGMKLGSGSTAVAKTSTGSNLTTYLTGSQQAITGGYPTSAVNSGKRRITWQSGWAAGVATTASPITEAVIVNDTLADATSPSANTLARVLLTGIASKGASDTLTLTWNWDVGT